jgi:hypothetical protein
VLDQRGQLLRAAVGFAGCSMPSYDRALHALRSWLDSWSGIGHITVGMARQGYDLQLTRYDEKGWRATFYTTGREHSPTSATGTGWKRTPWHATQRAAWEAQLTGPFVPLPGGAAPSRSYRGEATVNGDELSGRSDGVGCPCAFTLRPMNLKESSRSDRRPPLASLAPHQPRPARDAAHALERRGMESGRARGRSQ